MNCMELSWSICARIWPVSLSYFTNHTRIDQYHRFSQSILKWNPQSKQCILCSHHFHLAIQIWKLWAYEGSNGFLSVRYEWQKNMFKEERMERTTIECYVYRGLHWIYWPIWKLDEIFNTNEWIWKGKRIELFENENREIISKWSWMNLAQWTMHNNWKTRNQSKVKSDAFADGFGKKNVTSLHGLAHD